VLCPRCTQASAAALPRRTARGERTFRCPRCRRRFNERTGTPFNHLQVPTDSVLLVVLWRLRYKRSLRDLAELFLERGVVCSHEAVRDWEARFAPLLAAQLRAKRRGAAGGKWHADETDSKVSGTWCYRYRAIDRAGNLVDVRLSQTRDMDAAQRFFLQALARAGAAPRRTGMTPTRAPSARPWAIASTTGPAATRTSGSSRITGASRALLPQARVRFIRLGRPLLLGLRGAASVLPRPGPLGRARLARRTPSPLPGSLGCGHGRADRRLLSVGAGLAPPCALPSSTRRPP